MSKHQHKKRHGRRNLIVGLAVVLVVGGVTTAAAVTNNLSLGVGDTSQVTCAGTGLEISNQQATSLDLNCVGATTGGSPSGQTYVYEGAATTNYSTSALLRASAITYRTLVQFPTPVPSGQTVTGANLTFTPNVTETGGFQVHTTGSFTPSTVTWNSQPTMGAVIGSGASTVTGVPVVIPLTGLPTAATTNLELTYSPSGIIGVLDATGITLNVTYSGGVPPTTTTPTTSPSTTTTPTTTPPTTTTPTTVPTTSGNKVMVIMEENHSQSESYASMPYLASLASTYGKATSYYAIGHPSLPNYLAIFGGSTFGTSSDCSVGCGPTGATDTSVWDQTIAAGKTAKAYQESMPSNCATGGSGNYAPRHGPWPYWTNATSRANCTANDVPLTALQADITAGTLPITGEITPNLQNDWHDGTAAQADAFLQTWVPALQAGSDYTSGKLTVIIVTDEDDSSAGNNVAFTVVNKALSGKVVTGTYNHYSLTKWLDDNAGVAELNNAAGAANLKTAFGL